MVIARSLKDAARFGSATTSLLLRRSEDLVCQNLMCAKLGGACLCRLAVHLSRLVGLRELDIAGNDLGMLPEPVFELPALEHLDASGACDVGAEVGPACCFVDWLECATMRPRDLDWGTKDTAARRGKVQGSPLERGTKCGGYLRPLSSSSSN